MGLRGGLMSEAELDLALSVTERGFHTSPPSTRFTSLCLMAVIVARYPPGDAQDAAEDRLAAAIARCDLEHDEMDVIRRFRRGGLKAGMKRLSLNEQAEPSLRKQF
jgi:hypothetical protein